MINHLEAALNLLKKKNIRDTLFQNKLDQHAAPINTVKSTQLFILLLAC